MVQLLDLTFMRMNLLYFILGPAEEKAAREAKPPRRPRFTRFTRRTKPMSIQERQELTTRLIKNAKAVTVELACKELV